MLQASARNAAAFDEAAKTWDADPAVTKLAKNIFRSIKNFTNFDEKSKESFVALDFGAGTGNISIQLAPFCHKARIYNFLMLRIT